MDKTKILWVVFDFVQAGGQRYVYEICKALDNNKYQVDILRVSDLLADKNWNKEYYYQPTIDLGISIFFLDQIIGVSKSKPSIAKKIANKVKHKLSFPTTTDKTFATQKQKLESFFAAYKYVNFSGLGVFEFVCINRNLHPANSIIHILTAKFQGLDIYKKYDKEKSYFFVSGFEPHILKSELSQFKNYKHVYLPLSLQSDSFSIKNKGKPYLKIGVFTRLSHMKPLDPYLYALKLLYEKGLNVKLHIYGAGDPSSLGLIRQLEYLYIADKVIFCGHTESIKDALLNEDFDLVWFQSINGQLAGYAALEIALAAVPQVLWDFNYIGEEGNNQNCFPCFTNLTDFVELSNQLLLDKTTAKELGKNQQKFVTETHLIEKNIKTLESIYNHVD